MPKEILKQIQTVRGDITSIKTDAIVNAANNSLLGGGGVDGAIHKAAGPELLHECRQLNGCKTGEAKITKGYNLPCQYIIHTVGPVWRGGNYSEATLLESCYKNCLIIADEKKLSSIAFPAISTGIYGYPIGQACEIAVNTCLDFKTTSLKEIIFVCFNELTYELYNKKIQKNEQCH